MRIFISDIIVKKDRYGSDYYWIVGQLRCGKRVIIEDVYFNLQKYIDHRIEMLLSFMRSPYLELQMGIHNEIFLSEEYYSVELIDELLNTKGVILSGKEKIIILTGEYIDSYTIPEKWKSLIQRKSFKMLFKDPSALKTEDGTYLLYPFHSRKRFPIESISQRVTMAGSLRLEAWCLNGEESLVNSLEDSIERKLM
ncbi:MAG: hypothetical protein ACFE91_02565 [Promethearchaeota archaeon]